MNILWSIDRWQVGTAHCPLPAVSRRRNFRPFGGDRRIRVGPNPSGLSNAPLGLEPCFFFSNSNPSRRVPQMSSSFHHGSFGLKKTPHPGLSATSSVFNLVPGCGGLPESRPDMSLPDSSLQIFPNSFDCLDVSSLNQPGGEGLPTCHVGKHVRLFTIPWMDELLHQVSWFIPVFKLGFINMVPYFRPLCPFSPYQQKDGQPHVHRCLC